MVRLRPETRVAEGGEGSAEKGSAQKRTRGRGLGRVGQQSLRARYRGLFATDPHSIVEVKRSQGQQCGQSLGVAHLPSTLSPPTSRLNSQPTRQVSL